jgi:hypothetical protein
MKVMLSDKKKVDFEAIMNPFSASASTSAAKLPHPNGRFA